MRKERVCVRERVRREGGERERWGKLCEFNTIGANSL